MDIWDEDTVYLRHTDKKGSSYVEEHRCWHRARFLDKQQHAATNEGGSVAVVTRDEYRAAKWKK